VDVIEQAHTSAGIGFNIQHSNLGAAFRPGSRVVLKAKFA
jgi:hypothetical protein